MQDMTLRGLWSIMSEKEPVNLQLFSNKWGKPNIPVPKLYYGVRD